MECGIERYEGETTMEGTSETMSRKRRKRPNWLNEDNLDVDCGPVVSGSNDQSIQVSIGLIIVVAGLNVLHPALRNGARPLARWSKWRCQYG